MGRHLSLCNRSFAVALATIAAAVPVAGQTSGSRSPSTGAAQIELGGRVQTQFNTTTADDEPTSQLFLRRVRIEVKVKVNDLVSGEIQPDFANGELSLKDAFLNFTFSDGLELLVGQAFRPFSLLEQTSSRRMPPIERGARLRGIDALDHSELISGLSYSDRDVGLQITGAPSGAPLGLEYAAGIFRGPLHGEVGPRDTYQYAARASVAPFDRTRIGGGWSSRHFARVLSGEQEQLELRRGNAWEVDLEYGSFDPGVHLLTELAFGDFDPISGARFLGAQAWLAYRTRPVGILEAVEPIFRLSHGSVNADLLDEEGDGGTLVTPGFNLYFGGWNRVMVNYDLWLPDGGRRREGSFKTQFQLVF